MWSITFSISLASLARNHLGNRSGRNSFLRTIFLYYGTFIVASEVVTNITCCEIKINALLRRWQIIFGDMEINKVPEALARFARSLIIMMNVMLKARCYRLAPLLFGGNHLGRIGGHERPPFFTFQNCPVLQKLNHVVCPPPPPPHFKMDLRPCITNYLHFGENPFRFG